MIVRTANEIRHYPSCGRSGQIQANDGLECALSYCARDFSGSRLSGVRRRFRAFEFMGHRRTSVCASVTCEMRSARTAFRLDEGFGGVDKPASAESAIERREARGVALFVEHRDEVFARIDADLSDGGMRVVRAATATEGLRQLRSCKPSLVVAHIRLTDQSGWLFTAKLRFTNCAAPVWLYQPASVEREVELAEFLGVGELFDYGGDLLNLSRMIVNRIRDQE